MTLDTVTRQEVILFSFVILLVFLLLFAICCFGWWMSHRKPSLSPYSKLPLRQGSDINWTGIEKVLRYLYDMHEYDNRIFNMRRAAVCRETGRIFPNCVDWFGKIDLDWTFLEKRHPGIYVSWGSLTAEQQEQISMMHDSLEGFQTGVSCPEPAPRAITPKYAFTKPGPLYVDLETDTLLGWKCIPETSLEVMVVQKVKVDYIT